MGLIYGIANVTLAIVGICLMLVIVFVRTFYSLCKRILREQNENNRVDAHREMEVEDECPICLEHKPHIVQATCGHMYCLECFSEYYAAQGHIQLPCPMCRQKITFLFKNYRQVPPEKVEEDKRIDDYNYFYNNAQRSWLRLIRESPFLFSRFMREVLLTRGLALCHNLHLVCIIISFVFYFLSPLDLLPEALLGFIGLIDDIILLFLMFMIVGQAFLNEQRNRNVAAQRAA